MASAADLGKRPVERAGNVQFTGSSQSLDRFGITWQNFPEGVGLWPEIWHLSSPSSFVSSRVFQLKRQGKGYMDTYLLEHDAVIGPAEWTRDLSCQTSERLLHTDIKGKKPQVDIYLHVHVLYIFELDVYVHSYIHDSCLYTLKRFKHCHTCHTSCSYHVC